MKTLKNFYQPIENLDGWRQLLARPGKHWQDGYSAKALATRWYASDGFPEEVASSFRESKIPELRDLRFVIGLPEYEVPLPGGQRPSQTDVMVLARGAKELFVVAVEGKLDETFGRTVKQWSANASPGKLERLAYLTKLLGLAGKNIDRIGYQLLHRTASALITAEAFAAQQAVVLVHSFSQDRTGFDDYSAFLKLFGIAAAESTVQSAGKVADKVAGKDLYFSWTIGE